MAYFLAVDSRIQSLSSDRQLSTLLREVASGIQVEYISTFNVNLPASTVVEVPLGSIERLKLIALKSVDADFDVSFNTDALVNVWSGFGSRYHMRVFGAGAIVQAVRLMAASIVTVEVVLGGNAIV